MPRKRGKLKMIADKAGEITAKAGDLIAKAASSKAVKLAAGSALAVAADTLVAGTRTGRAAAGGKTRRPARSRRRIAKRGKTATTRRAG
jgi:hypothetical protein